MKINGHLSGKTKLFYQFMIIMQVLGAVGKLIFIIVGRTAKKVFLHKKVVDLRDIRFMAKSL